MRNEIGVRAFLVFVAIGCLLCVRCLPSGNENVSEFPDKIPGMRSLFDEPVTDAAVAEVEGKWNSKLPDDYRQFLSQWNGVYFIGLPIVFDLQQPTNPDHAIVSLLYGLASEPSIDDLRYGSNGYDFKERVPDHIIAIGGNASHERIAMSLGADDYGHVYHWHPALEWEDEENMQTYECLTLLARSFTEFYDRIQQNPDPKYHDWPK